MICLACGSAANKPEAKFCRECGHKFNPQSVAEISACSRCGTGNKAGSKFCRSCGAVLTTLPDTKLATALPPTGHLELCTSCGRTNPSGRRFCKHCGSQILAATRDEWAGKSFSLAESPPAESIDELQAIQPSSPQSNKASAVHLPEPEQQQQLLSEVAVPIVPPVEHLQISLPEASEQSHSSHPQASGLTRKPVNTRLIVLLAGVLLLGGGGAAYLWWQQTSAKPLTQGPFSTEEGEVASVPMKNQSSYPQQPDKQEASPSIQPSIAEATVRSETNPATPILPITKPLQPISQQDATPSPAQHQMTAPVKRVPSEPREAQPTVAQEPVATPPRRQERTSAQAETEPTGVPEMIEQKCAGLSGFKRVICEEETRMKLCTDKWGTIPGCPKYEHEDPFKF